MHQRGKTPLWSSTEVLSKWFLFSITYFSEREGRGNFCLINPTFMNDSPKMVLHDLYDTAILFILHVSLFTLLWFIPSPLTTL